MAGWEVNEIYAMEYTEAEIDRKFPYRYWDHMLSVYDFVSTDAERP
jgi:hypothetical protein